ncbi:MAG TPA: hypothetical protein VGY57_01730, partial [Vicinamibacterales bacterium]|nr:hypothetical protein [Vicinamibacterales bacterium]
MQRRAVAILVLARVLLVAASVAVGSIADLRASTAAMACCVKTHNRCAGLSTPDDCCKRMGHATSAGVAGTLSVSQAHVLPATVVAW